MALVRFSSRLAATIIFLLLAMPFSSSAQTKSHLDYANLLIMKGNYRPAISMLRNFVSGDSTNPTAHYLLGMAYQSLFQHDSALVFLKRARILNPEDQGVLLALGRSLGFTGLVKDAREVYETVLAKDSTNRIAASNVGKIYLEQNQLVKADSIYASLFARDSTNSYFLKQLGISALKSNRLDDAIGYYERARGLNNRDVDIVLKLSQVYFKRDEFHTALEVTNEGLRHYPDNFHLIKRKAEILFQLRQYKDAIRFYLKVVVRGDTTASTFKRLGMCSYFEEQMSLALEALKAAFAKDSTDGLICYYLGLAHKELGNHRDAIHFLSKSIELSTPNYLSEIYTQLASACELDHDYVQAIRLYKKALELDPKHKVLLFYLASVYDQFYADREVPLSYYKKFLRESRNIDEKLERYAESRVKKLVEESHFSKR